MAATDTRGGASPWMFKQQTRLVVVAGGLLAAAACSPPTHTAASSATPQPVVASASPVSATTVAALQRGEVALENVGGTYVIPVLINNTITLKFAIDSGASDVSIPADVASTLVRSGTITSSDFIGNQTFQLADGSTVPSAEFRIRSLKVGNLELQNVTATLANANGPLLLGQTFLSRLSSWSIDNARHVLLLNQGPLAPAPLEPAPTEVAALSSGSDAGDDGTSKPDASEVTSNSVEQQASAQATAYFASWSGLDASSAANVRQFYASSVNFYGSSMDIGSLMATKMKFANRWPVRAYTVQGPMNVSCQDEHTCLVQGVTHWDASNPDTGRHSTGQAQFSLRFQDGLIVAENGRVLARQ
jgi:predicted aspartyl protease